MSAANKQLSKSHEMTQALTDAVGKWMDRVGETGRFDRLAFDTLWQAYGTGFQKPEWGVSPKLFLDKLIGLQAELAILIKQNPAQTPVASKESKEFESVSSVDIASLEPAKVLA
jgi:hypothetical protein